jgi:hypothetical protein
MSKRKDDRLVSHGLILALVFLIGANLGCKMLGGGTANTNSDAKTAKGIPADKICQLLADPGFENNSAYNGAGCSGSTYFGVKDNRTASYETDLRPAFSYGAIGEQGVITKVTLSMTKRPDGAQFFLAKADAVARMINGQPLPKEIENAITGPLSGLGGDFTTTSKIENAKFELVRSNTDNRFYLSFEF